MPILKIGYALHICQQMVIQYTCVEQELESSLVFTQPTVRKIRVTVSTSAIQGIKCSDFCASDTQS